ncbi:LPPG:FO 2-phospho-L-lactate transferase [Paraoerskovia marina]|uniref:LPPG:FO 2-phospho-L-lactate transferase n=1 Tax=Paraoerskovia marina TaxID=545619 RepID=A0A1H1U5L2_9CELL|nr:2-phospho-L-lactate transferase [Paraoerskovia marina]SDS67768.1 LPPG:FO 2-phospho-L-lactate transferase [Paraoerskovia marina]
MRITLLAGGVGGARFTRGLRDHLARHGTPDGTSAEITVVVNTGDDIWLHGLRVCPDLDTVMYTLGGGIHEGQGWGRPDESRRVTDELHAYGLGWDWFTLGDLDLGTHVARTAMLREGLPLSTVTERLAVRWQPGVHLLPMSDQPCETHVEVDDASSPSGTRLIHFEEWWVRHRAALPARRFVQVGLDDARPAPGVLDAITRADLVLLPPSNPVVSVGTILGVPGIREAMTRTSASVVGVSPILGGAPVRGMADACLTTIGVETSAEAVARHYGSRREPSPTRSETTGVLDGWLVDDADASAVERLEDIGITARALPLLMGDEPGADGRTATGRMVDAAFGVAAARQTT